MLRSIHQIRASTSSTPFTGNHSTRSYIKNYTEANINSGRQKSERISKTLSFLLRHGAVQENLPIRGDGYVPVTSLLQHPLLRGVGFPQLESAVTKDRKHRFQLLLQPAEGMSQSDMWWVRANQGHSIKNVELNLERVASPKDVKVAIHGTTLEAWEVIKHQGISKMNRNHIHLAEGVPGTEVVSGIRNSSKVLIYIDLEKAFAAGIKFYRSINRVILTEGNTSGFLEPQFFERVDQVKIVRKQIQWPPKAQGNGAAIDQDS